MLALMFLVAAAGADLVPLPPGVTTQGLLELTKQGEVWYLPVHDRLPFRAAVSTRAAGACAKMEAAMMDVEGYKDRWPMKKVTILERTPDRVRYELTLDLMMAPTVPGIVERLGPGRVRFSDPETGSQSQWRLVDNANGCAMTFSLKDQAGKEAGYVSVARAIESSTSDTINMSGAIASVRGYTKAESVPGGPALGEAGLAAWRAAADEGTILRYQRDPRRDVRVHGARRVQLPPDRVLWAIRNREGYAAKTDVIDKASARGADGAYKFGFFGGSVSLKTKIVEEGTIETGLRIIEKVVAGDIEQGTWTWTVQAIEGGTHVELLMDMNIIPGSTILSALAREDPGFKDGMALHLTTQFLGRVVGGKAIGRRPAPTSPEVATR